MRGIIVRGEMELSVGETVLKGLNVPRRADFSRMGPGISESLNGENAAAPEVGHACVSVFRKEACRRRLRLTKKRTRREPAIRTIAAQTTPPLITAEVLELELRAQPK